MVEGIDPDPPPPKDLNLGLLFLRGGLCQLFVILATTTTRLPLVSDSAACSAWSRHTMTVKNAAPHPRPDRLPPRAPLVCLAQ